MNFNIEKYRPRISVFTNFLSEEDWSIVDNYCRNQKGCFPFVGYDSPVRWRTETHSKNSNLKYAKSFLVGEEEYALYKDGKITEPYPNDQKHGDNYDVSIKVLEYSGFNDNHLSEVVLMGVLGKELENKIYDILNDNIKNIIEYIKIIYDLECFSESGPWLTLTKEGGAMKMHCDGTFINNRDAVTQFSSVYYINDDYEGGEFNMPVMGFKLKPKANSLLIFSHSSHEDMAHEVTPVISGDRFVSQGFFAIKKD
jgi:hypothetical protein